MPDITMCSPTKFTKKCQICYRMTAKPDKWQSYANLSNPCHFMPIATEVTMDEYSKRMDKIIKKGGAVNETLIALLDEANKYRIVEVNKKVKSVKSSLSKRKKGKHGQKVPKAVKRVRK